MEAGAVVGIGHDSIMDPWYPLGVGNILQAASMLAHVAQMTTPAWFERIVEVLVNENHAAWGGAPLIAVGSPAEFIVHNSKDYEAILRIAEPPRWVVKSGRVLAQTSPATSSVMGSVVTPGRT
jgi:cytosine deaminase